VTQDTTIIADRPFKFFICTKHKAATYEEWYKGSMKMLQNHYALCKHTAAYDGFVYIIELNGTTPNMGSNQCK
jgi:hypothetical protein